MTPGIIAVDLFAGGGGASEGIRRATGQAPIIAVNHNPAAVRMHAENHPDTLHYCEDVYAVNPEDATRGHRVDLLWASPDCTHFSRAKGGKPRDKTIRGLAWIIVEWAKAVEPRVICMENVEEFQGWGPLGADGQPDKARAGETFRAFVAMLRGLGYTVAWKVLCAADYGAPTSRKRLFLVARRDGGEVRWPTPTHGPGRALPWLPAAGCIDWSLSVPSIFLSPSEGRAARVKRPLAEPTLRRIAAGIKRYVLDAGEPFLVHVNHGRDPNRSRSVDKPFPTITASHGLGLVAPTMIQMGYGEREGQAPRCLDIEAPLGTIVAGGVKHALVTPTLAPCVVGFDNQSSSVGEWSVERPLNTITSKARFGVASAFLARAHSHGWDANGSDLRAADRPMWTVTAKNESAVCAAFLARHYTGVVGRGLDAPMLTVTAIDHHSLVAAHLTKFYGTSTGAPLDAPMPTITAGGDHGGGHLGLVAAFLRRYAGIDDASVMIQGERWSIVDIGMRMLVPRELARAQGFPDHYVLTGSIAEQVARIGNSVCPDVAYALVRAQFDTDGDAEMAAK